MQITITPQQLFDIALGFWFLLMGVTAIWYYVRASNALELAQEARAAMAKEAQAVEDHAAQVRKDTEEHQAGWRELPPMMRDHVRDHQVIVPIMREISRVEGDALKCMVVMVQATDGAQLRVWHKELVGRMEPLEYSDGPEKDMLRTVAQAMAEVERRTPGRIGILQAMLDEQVLLINEDKAQKL